MNKIMNRAMKSLEIEKITTNFYNLKLHVSNNQVNDLILLKIS